MIPKPFDEIGVDEINDLIESEYQEDSTIEYKLELPGSTEDKKKEFLFDVTAFANLNGGDIVFGISDKIENGENTGIPEKVIGLKGINAEKEILRLENLIQSKIAPRIVGVQIKSISDFDEGPVILMRIPQSLLIPHAVKGKSKSFYFYIRDNGGKHPMDYDELRSVFEISGSYTEKIREFRFDRIKNLKKYMPVDLNSDTYAILHIIPFNALRQGIALDIEILFKEMNQLKPTSRGGYLVPTYNFDGFYIAGKDMTHSFDSYIQVFRTGSVESVTCTTRLFDPDEKVIYENKLVEFLSDNVSKVLSKYRKISIQAPIFIMFSLINIENYKFWINYQMSKSLIPRLRNELYFPEIVINNLDDSEKEILYPLFDILHQTAGYPDE